MPTLNPHKLALRITGNRYSRAMTWMLRPLLKILKITVTAPITRMAIKYCEIIEKKEDFLRTIIMFKTRIFRVLL